MSVSTLSPTFARPGAAPRSRCSSTSSRRPRCWTKVAGRRSPASATRRSSSKEVAIRSRLWEDRIRQVLLCSGSMGFSQGHHPRSEGHLFCCPGSRITKGGRWIRVKSPIYHGLEIARRNNVRWLVIARGSQLRLYPTSPDVGVGRRGATQTYFGLDLALLD